jgi:hypothetical protein
VSEMNRVSIESCIYGKETKNKMRTVRKKRCG